MRSLTLAHADHVNMVQKTAVLMGTAVAWAGLCAMVIRIVASGYGYPTTWLATGNAWVALMTLPALLAVGVGESNRERTKWFFWLGLPMAPSQATALIFAMAWA